MTKDVRVAGEVGVWMVVKQPVEQLLEVQALKLWVLMLASAPTVKLAATEVLLLYAGTVILEAPLGAVVSKITSPVDCTQLEVLPAKSVPCTQPL